MYYIYTVFNRLNSPGFCFKLGIHDPDFILNKTFKIIIYGDKDRTGYINSLVAE